MSLDMGGHIDGTFASVPATRTTYSGGSYVEGKWSAGTGVASTHVCTIQPMSNKEIDNLDSGAERLLDVRKIYINDGTVGKLAESDTWVFSGLDGVFKTIAIDNRPWRTYAKIIVSRIDRIKVVVSFTVHPVPLELEHLPIVVNFTAHPLPLALTEAVIVNFTQHPVPLELEHFPPIEVNFTSHPVPLTLDHLPIVVNFTAHPVPLELDHLPIVVNFTAHPVPLALTEPSVIVNFTQHPVPLALDHLPIVVNFTTHPVALSLDHLPIVVNFTTHPVALALEEAGGPSVNDMILTARTTGASETFTLPLQNTAVPYNFSVDWGDGNVETNFLTYNDARLVHTYLVADDYDIVVSGVADSPFFNNSGDDQKVIDIKAWGKTGWTTGNATFWGCTNLTVVTAGTESDTTGVTNFRYFLRRCLNMTSVDITGLDTSSNTTLDRTFSQDAALTTLDLNSMNTALVTNMNLTFFGCTVLDPDISGFDITSLTTATQMMDGCAFGDANYKAAIKAWEAQVGKNDNVSIHFGSATLVGDSAAIAARLQLTTPTGSGGNGWTIIDGDGTFP